MGRTVQLAAVIFTAFIAGSSAADEPRPVCEHSPLIVGECFTVHGRLSLFQGNPGIRIWRIGTRRMLGVLDAMQIEQPDKEPYRDAPFLPPSVERLLASDPDRLTAVYGNYRVCPFAKEQPGHMQYVCVESASNLVARRLGAN